MSVLLEREVLGVFAVGTRAHVVAELAVSGDSPLAGEAVGDLEERFGARVLSAGDLVVVAPPPALAELTRALEGASS